jgi:hypothetical protein
VDQAFAGIHQRNRHQQRDRVLRDNLDENGGGNQSLKRRPAAKV